MKKSGKSSDYKLQWTDESIENLRMILNDIQYKWTTKEVNIFKNKLSHQLDLITQNPYMFPVSHFNPRLRRAVLSRQTTIFYEVRNNIIFLAYLHLNRKDIDEIK